MQKPKIVVIGGGTGTFTVLSGLKKYPVDLSAIVTMADDGGSTGILRDELGVLPPGDVRQCLVALSASPGALRKLMNYRFSQGGLRGHSFGNLFLSALEKMTGSFDKAVEIAGEVLHIEGHVIPSTLHPVRLVAELKNRKKIFGEANFHAANLKGISKIYLKPSARANPKALKAIREADLIAIGPGDWYSSIIPNLLVGGIPEAIRKAKAYKVLTCNLMTKRGHTDGFTVDRYAHMAESHLKTRLDYVIWNNQVPSRALLKRYARGGEYPVLPPDIENRRFVGADLISWKIPERQRGDMIKRSLIRHNPNRLAKLLMRIVYRKVWGF
jgi:uncharacterized cofD-like protein